MLNVINLLRVTNRRAGSVALVNAISGFPLLESMSATLGEEPEMELAWVIVPIRTERLLHFTARLTGIAPMIKLAGVGAMEIDCGSSPETVYRKR